MIISRKRLLCMFFALAVVVQLGYYFEFLEFSEAPQVETFEFRSSRSPSSSSSSLLPSSTLFAPLQVLCSKTAARPNVYINCSTIAFPTFEAINQLQVCIRWAIDAGVGIIKPNFVKLHGNESILPDVRVNVDFLLDESFLWEALQTNCPQVKVILPEQVKNETFIELNGDPFFNGKLYRKGSYSRYVQNRFIEEKILNGTKVVIREDGSFCGWERRRDPLPLQIAFKHLFRFNKSLLTISARILSHLPSSFFGILLPSEHEHADAAVMDEFLDEVLRRNTSAYPCVYVASDNERAMTEFTHRAQLHGLNATHRWNATTSVDADWMLNTLNADQLRVVDHAVMEKAVFGFGSSGSIEAFMLGMDRHITQFGDLEYHGIDRQQYLLGSRLNLWDGNSW